MEIQLDEEADEERKRKVHQLAPRRQRSKKKKKTGAFQFAEDPINYRRDKLSFNYIINPEQLIKEASSLCRVTHNSLFITQCLCAAWPRLAIVEIRLQGRWCLRRGV